MSVYIYIYIYCIYIFGEMNRLKTINVNKISYDSISLFEYIATYSSKNGSLFQKSTTFMVNAKICYISQLQVLTLRVVS